MKAGRAIGLAMVAWASQLATSQAGIIVAPVVITDDSNANISATNTYTHLLDFIADGSPATINGVAFTAADTTGGNWSSTNFSGTIPEGSFNGGGLATGASSGSGLEKLLKDFYYNGGPPTTPETLTPGVQYETHVYYRAWDTSNRTTAITFDEGNGLAQSITVDQNAPTATAKYLSYIFTAQSSGNLVMTYAVAGGQTNASWHDYGVTNQVSAVPEPSSLILAALAGLGLLVLRRRGD